MLMERSQEASGFSLLELAKRMGFLHGLAWMPWLRSKDVPAYQSPLIAKMS